MGDRAKTKGVKSGNYTGTRSNNGNAEKGVGDKSLVGCGSQVDSACQLCQTTTGGQYNKSLICKRCKKNYCITCLKKDEVEYVILQKQDTGIMWFCPCC